MQFRAALPLAARKIVKKVVVQQGVVQQGVARKDYRPRPATVPGRPSGHRAVPKAR